MGKTTGMAASEGAWMNFWIREDWLDKLGLKMPKSIAEITAALEAFKANGPTLVPAGKDVIPTDGLQFRLAARRALARLGMLQRGDAEGRQVPGLQP